MKTLNDNINGNKTKWQIKTLSTDASTDIALITFNVEVGKTYKISVNGLMTTNATDGYVQIRVDDGSVVLGNPKSGYPLAGVESSVGFVCIYTATSPTLTVNSTSATANAVILGNGTRSETHAILEELPNHVETNQW